MSASVIVAQFATIPPTLPTASESQDSCLTLQAETDGLTHQEVNVAAETIALANELAKIHDLPIEAVIDLALSRIHAVLAYADEWNRETERLRQVAQTKPA